MFLHLEEHFQSCMGKKTVGRSIEKKWRRVRSYTTAGSIGQRVLFPEKALVALFWKIYIHKRFNIFINNLLYFVHTVFFWKSVLTINCWLLMYDWVIHFQFCADKYV